MHEVGFEPTKVSQKILSLSHFPNLPLMPDGVFTTIFIIHPTFKPFHVNTLHAVCSFSTAPCASSSVEIGRYL